MVESNSFNLERTCIKVSLSKVELPSSAEQFNLSSNFKEEEKKYYIKKTSLKNKYNITENKIY